MSSDAYASLGTLMLAAQTQELQTQLAVFREGLRVFGEENGSEIRENSALRRQFVQVCTAIGADPLALDGSGGSEDLAVDLVVRVVEVCRDSRDLNGGILLVRELQSRLAEQHARLGRRPPSSEEVERAVRAVSALDGTFAVLEIKGRRYVKSVAEALDSDQQAVLDVCGVVGGVSERVLGDNLGWGKVRRREVVEGMVRRGVLWVDEHGGEVLYWLPLELLRGG